MTYRYLPIVRWKRDEQNALANVATAGRSNVAPTFTCGSQRNQDRAGAIPGGGQPGLSTGSVVSSADTLADAGTMPSITSTTNRHDQPRRSTCIN
jgi:hypothetical protein